MNSIFKIIFFSLIFFSISAKKAAAQCPNSLSIMNQKHVEEFHQNYPNCKHIEGNVSIWDTSVISLEGLLGLETIGGDLRLQISSLQNLKGLDSLKLVMGSLFFINNPTLESFTGLGNLREVRKIIDLYDRNPKPKNMQGFESLEFVGYSFHLNSNSITSLIGIKNLRFVGNNFVIQGLAIQDLNGLDNLDTVGIHLALHNLKRLRSLAGVNSLHYTSPNIAGCDSLKSLKGLETVESGVGIYLFENEQLESLDGLENFKQFSSFNFPWATLYLADNPRLSDLSALNHRLKMNNLYLFNNASLSICNVQAICDYLVEPGDSTQIYGNLQNCNSAEEIITFCRSFTSDLPINDGFNIFPNPISEGQPFQIIIENDFIGKVNIDISDLNGNVFKNFEKVKTSRLFSENIQITNMWPNQFMVRVSDGQSSKMRLIFKF